VTDVKSLMPSLLFYSAGTILHGRMDEYMQALLLLFARNGACGSRFGPAWTLRLADVRHLGPFLALPGVPFRIENSHVVLSRR